MMYNIIFSPTGGTKKVADILINHISNENKIVDLCDPNLAPIQFNSEDVAMISIPSYAGRVPCTAVDRMKKITANHTKAILVCVYGNRAYDNTLAEMKDLAEKAGFKVVAAVSAIAEHSMVRNLAAHRPDAQDEAILIEMVAQIKDKLEAKNDTPIQVPGEVPDKPMGNFGGKMAPSANEGCTYCGVCAKQCPTLAINPETMKADKTKCIGCMRCISVCPSNARKLNVVIESLGGVALSVLCTQRKENELFL